MPVDKERPKKCQSSASRTYFFFQFYRHPERPLAVQLAQSEILLQPFATLERIRDVLRISYSNHGGRPSLLATLLTLTGLAISVYLVLWGPYWGPVSYVRWLSLAGIFERRCRNNRTTILAALEWMKSPGRDTIYIMNTFLCEYQGILIPSCM